MAEKLLEMPRKRGRATQHPWAEWADGSIWKIQKDVDFEGNVESMRTQLYGRARALKCDTEVVVDKEEQSITFRMIPWEHPWDELITVDKTRTLTTDDFTGTVDSMISKLGVRVRTQRLILEVTHKTPTEFTYTVKAKPKAEEEVGAGA